MNILRELQALESNVIKLREGTPEMHAVPEVQINGNDVRRGKCINNSCKSKKRHFIDSNSVRTRPPIAPKPMC